MKSPHLKSVRLLQEKYQENLETMFKNLLKDESLCDVTIHCRDGVVRGHRVILAACSPYFRKIFQDHSEPLVVFLVHGVPVKHMKSLLELIYRGSTDVSSELTSKMFEIADDFGIKGIVDENDRPMNSSGRDTRFRGQKRVVVDFEKESVNADAKTPSLKLAKININERRISSCSDKKSTDNQNANASTDASTSPHQNYDSSSSLLTFIKQEPQSPGAIRAPTASQLSAEARRRNNWAMKQRKYKCNLCPASFKRASHLTRHQLVHTGERPYRCAECDKAFSRHDKLKHHVRKTHEAQHLDDLYDASDSNLYTIGRVDILTPQVDFSEEPAHITREDLMPKESPPPKTPESIPKITSTPKIFQSTPSEPHILSKPAFSAPLGQKKGRGRPRKYPPVPRPLVKRPRGRPRLNHTAPTPGYNTKYENSLTHLPQRHSENYDLTNMPFGDLEYLTNSVIIKENPEHFEDSTSAMDPGLMEPLVEIETGQNEPIEKEEPTEHHTAGSFLQNIGLLENSSVANIGECTISLTNTPSSPAHNSP